MLDPIIHSLSITETESLTLSVESGEVGQCGRPIITLTYGIVVKLVFGSQNILVLLKNVTKI